MRTWSDATFVQSVARESGPVSGLFPARRNVDDLLAPVSMGGRAVITPGETAGSQLADRMTDGEAAAPVANGVAAAQTDAELMLRVAAGDHLAFAALYDHHVGAVYGAVLRYLRDPGSAEDVAQETLLAMWQRPDAYAAEKGSLVGWLLSIARHRAIDRLRAASRRPLLVGLDAGAAEGSDSDLERLAAVGQTAGGGSAAEDPPGVAERRWVRAVVRTALDGMPEPARRVLVLAYDDGLTQMEIAAHLGWPPGTVKTRTRRALLRMRAMLESVPDIGPWGAASPVESRSDTDGVRHGSR